MEREELNCQPGPPDIGWNFVRGVIGRLREIKIFLEYRKNVVIIGKMRLLRLFLSVNCTLIHL